MTEGELFQLWREVLIFLDETPGIYRQGVTEQVEENVAENLCSGRYYLQRNGTGEITAFCHYWKIQPEDVAIAGSLTRPEQVADGPLVFVLDCATRSGDMRRLVRDLRRQEPQTTGCAWRREWLDGDGRKQWEICCFSRQKGVESG